MLIHEHALVKIRDDMPRDKAALIGCGVTTGVGAGLSCINGAAIAEAKPIIADDRVGSKLNLAKEFSATRLS